MVRTVKLFVEGGGDSKPLRTECRTAFNSFLQKAGLSGYMPRVVASGSRNAAYSDYCTAIKNGENAVLLVDSESEIITQKDNANSIPANKTIYNPWYHLTNRKTVTRELADHWEKPAGASDDDCHLMVQSMESWFLADIDALKTYYGNEFNEKSLLNRKDIESIPKKSVFAALNVATQNTQKGSYNKGKHSFDILSIIDSNKVCIQSPWAKRFVTLMTEKMMRLRDGKNEEVQHLSF